MYLYKKPFFSRSSLRQLHLQLVLEQKAVQEKITHSAKNNNINYKIMYIFSFFYQEL